MASFISNQESINSLALRTARANDTHSNDAMLAMLSNIYNAAPNAVIVEQGVNYRVTTNDFQAWAIYYNPDIISAYSATGVANQLQILAAASAQSPYYQAGQYQVVTNPGYAIGDYFCVAAPEYGAGVTFADSYAYYLFLGQYIPYGGWINITWEDGGVYYKTTFTVVGNDDVDGLVILQYNSGDPIPGTGTTGRYGVTGTNQ